MYENSGLGWQMCRCWCRELCIAKSKSLTVIVYHSTSNVLQCTEISMISGKTINMHDLQTDFSFFYLKWIWSICNKCYSLNWTSPLRVSLDNIMSKIKKNDFTQRSYLSSIIFSTYHSNMLMVLASCAILSFKEHHGFDAGGQYLLGRRLLFILFILDSEYRLNLQTLVGIKFA